MLFVRGLINRGVLEMRKDTIRIKAALAIAVACTFLLPGSAIAAINHTTTQNGTSAPTISSMVHHSSPMSTTIYVNASYDESTPGWGVDHFAKIQDGINVAQPGDTVFVYNGTYSEQILINKPINVVGESNTGTLIFGPASTTNVVSVYHTSNAQFHNFHIEADGSATTWRPIILGELASHCNISDLTMGTSSPKSYGFELDFCDNLTISNSNVNSYFRAFYIQGTVDSLFSNLQVQSLTEDGFDVFGATYIPTGATRGAVRNTYENIMVTIGGDRGFQGSWLDNLTIDHMTVVGGMSLSILAQEAPDAVISNSSGSGCSWGIAFNNAPRGRIVDCTYTNSGSNVGFGAWYGQEVVFDECVAENNGLVGLLIQEAPDSTMTNCVALNSTYEGIDITMAPNTVVSNCTVHNAVKDMGAHYPYDEQVPAPTITELRIRTSKDNHVIPLLSPRQLIEQASIPAKVSGQYLATTAKTNAIIGETTNTGEYTVVDVSKKYRDVQGLSLGSTPTCTPTKVGVETSVADVYGIALWQTNYGSILNCQITNAPIGINLISSPGTTLHGNSIVSGIFYLTGEFVQSIDTTNIIDGKPLKWVDGASHQVFDNPDVGFLAIVNSDNITVQNYQKSNSGWGLLFYNTASSIIQNCVFNGNLRGLGIIDCSGITVQTTTLAGNTINLDIYGGHPELHTISTNVTVNGNPVRYLKALSDQTIDGASLSIGYLGILASNDVTVTNVAISQNGQGILVAASQNILVSNCVLSNDDVGICIDHSTVSAGSRANTITGNSYGLFIIDDSEAHGFSISDNILSNINVVGSNNEVTLCDVSGASTGILMGPGASQNLLDHVSATSAWSYAFSLVGSHNNTLSYITTSYAGSVGIQFDTASDNIITNWESSYDYRGSWGIGYRNTIENSVVANPLENIMWEYYSKGYILHNITGYGVADSYGNGIMISASENFVVTDCTIHNAPTGIEISFVPGNNHTIMNCDITQVSNYALGMEVNIAWPYGAQHGLFAANNNTFTTCSIHDNPGIGLLQMEFAQSATFDQCSFTNNEMGMWLQFVQNDVVKNTVISGNQYNFGMPGYKLAHFLTNDIQNTTFVEGKPVLLILGQSNLVIDDPDVGWLGVIQCTNVTVKNFNMTHNGQGVLFAFTTDSTISDCYFTQNRLSIELYGCQGCTIINSTASDGAGGILMYDSRNNAISHCEASNNAGGDPGIFLLNASYSLVSDSDCSANTYPVPGFLLYNFAVNGGSNSTITNVTMVDVQFALSLTSSNDNHFSHLTILRSTDYGLYFSGGVRNEISDSTIRYVRTTASIYLYGSSYNHISHCIVRDSPGPESYGIALTYSSNYNLVEDCLVQNASLYYGIAIFYSANNNTIKDCQSLHAPSGQGCYVREASGNVYDNCTSSYNAQWGFRVRIATGNKIVNCNAAYNAVGIYAHETSHGNMFFYNNLFGNTQSQAYDDNVNTWDDGTHGNYYSDYNGNDTNGDGIGDTPYAIPGGSNLDHYPKMMPYPNLPPVVAFSWTPIAPNINQTVQFDSSASYDPDDSIATWYWTFGDGTGSYDANPTHAYMTGGLFTVTLTLTDHWDPPATATLGRELLVFSDIPPIADAGPDQTLNTPTVTLDGSNSYDPDGYIIAYLWDLGDGTVSYDMVTTHTYETDGTYQVTLTVIDNAGLIGYDSALVIVDSVKPTTYEFLTGTAGQNGWFTSPVMVTLVAIDDRSGIQQTTYRVDTGTWTPYTAPFDISANGTHILEYYSTDRAGNIEDTKTATVKIDRTAPTITLSIEKIGVNKWIITANVSDATSGVARVEFYIDNVSVHTDTIAPYNYTYTGPKNVMVTAVAYDNAGLSAVASGKVSLDLIVDKAGLSVIASGATSQGVSLLQVDEHVMTQYQQNR